MMKINDGPASNLVHIDYGSLQPQSPGIAPENSEPHCMQSVRLRLRLGVLLKGCYMTVKEICMHVRAKLLFIIFSDYFSLMVKVS
jgi:hypothetical protein